MEKDILAYVRSVLAAGATIAATDPLQPILSYMPDGRINGNLTVMYPTQQTFGSKL
jgi:hypothetical protein